MCFFPISFLFHEYTYMMDDEGPGQFLSGLHAWRSNCTVLYQTLVSRLAFFSFLLLGYFDDTRRLDGWWWDEHGYGDDEDEDDGNDSDDGATADDTTLRL